MPIPAANQGNSEIVTPLTTKYNHDFLTLPANGETAVKQKWFNAGDVGPIVIRPHLNREPLADPVAPQKKELDVRKFFPGGGS